MSCEHTQEQLLDYLNHELAPAQHQQLAAHLASCPDCQAELQSVRQTWQLLGGVPTPEPSENLRPAFYAMLADFKETEMQPRPASVLTQLWQQLQTLFTPQYAGRLAFGLGLLLVGLAGGYWLNSANRSSATAVKPATDQQQLAALTAQVQEMRQMMLLALIDNPSASERLRAVSYTKELEQPQPRVVEALLSTLNSDPNVNVRLATLEALAEMAPNDPTVRQGLVHALSKQDSPLVQSALADVMVQLQVKRSVQPLRRLLAQPGLNEVVKEKISESIQSLTPGDQATSKQPSHEIVHPARPARPADLVL